MGGVGPNESEPAVVQWQWYYHVPSFAGWALIVALLVLVNENRNRQAWLLILIPFLLPSEMLWPWIERLLNLLSSGAARQYGPPLQWLLVAWTAVWLLSPWLARRRPVTAFVSALGLAVTVNIAAQIAVYQDEWKFVVEPLTNYAIFVFALLVAFVLSGLCCRKTYRPGRFLAWLMPWLVVGVAVGTSCDLLWHFTRRPPFLFLLPRLAVYSACVAGVLYLLNLPFMILAFRCPLYRDRFQKLLRLPEYAPPATTFPDVCAEGKTDLEPFALSPVVDAQQRVGIAEGRPMEGRSAVVWFEGAENSA